MPYKIRRFALVFEILSNETNFLAEMEGKFGYFADDHRYTLSSGKTKTDDKGQRYLEVAFAPWPNDISQKEDIDFTELMEMNGAKELT